MPRRSVIELQGLIERIVEMFHREHLTHEEIAEALQKEGYKLSKSSVGRAIRAADEQAKKYKDAAKKFALLVAELKNVPGFELNESTIQLTSVKLAEELEKFENFEELNAKELISSIKQMADAQSKIAQVKLEYERGYKQGLFKAAEAAEKDLKKAGISDETVNNIKARILGLRVDNAKKKD